MSFQLPYNIDQEDIQGNFDALANAFPLSRRYLKLEQPVLVGGAGGPNFSGAWVNFGAANQPARFWKDSMGLVHIEGVIKSGTINTTAFQLPAGYRPGKDLIFPIDTNSGHGRLDVTSAGLVIPVSGGVTYTSITVPPFLQEN